MPALYLPQSPLVVVLAQIRFSPVAAMESYVPKIQDVLRRKGLPEFRQEDVDEVTWNVTPGAPPAVDVRKFKRWEFGDRAQKWLVSLTSDTLAVATSAYDRYDTTFSDHIELCVDTVRQHAEPDITTRLGLRYVDLIRPESNLGFADYLTDRLLGLEPEAVGMSAALPYSQLRGKTEIGAMMIRCVFFEDGQILPPDLRGTNLALSVRVPPGEVVAILDLDHLRSVEVPFDTSVTLEALGELHDALDHAFRRSVTLEAIERWKRPTENAAAGNAGGR